MIRIRNSDTTIPPPTTRRSRIRIKIRIRHYDPQQPHREKNTFTRSRNVIRMRIRNSDTTPPADHTPKQDQDQYQEF